MSKKPITRYISVIYEGDILEYNNDIKCRVHYV